MILTHQEISKKGLVSKSVRDHYLIMDISKFQNDEDEQNLKLTFELVAKMKIYKRINSFYYNIVTDCEIDIEKLNPVFEFLLHGKVLTDDQIRSFFEVEKQAQQFEEHLYKVGIEPEWGFSYHIHAAILGTSMSYLSNLDYGNNPDQIMDFEDFENAVLDFTMDKVAYGEFISKVNEHLLKMSEE